MADKTPLAPALVNEFVGRRKKVDEDAMSLLAGHAWRGNVRELRNVIEHAVLVTEGDVTADALPLQAPELVAAAARGEWSLERLEATYIREILRATRSNFSKAAQILGINRKTLLEKRRKYGI